MRKAVATVMLMGDSGVGKTHITACLKSDTPLEDFQPEVTVGVNFEPLEFLTIDYRNPEKKETKVGVSVIDPQGRDQGLLATGSFFRGLDAIIGVFDIANRRTYSGLIDQWLKNASELCQRHPTQLPLIVLANKMDLVTSGERKACVPLDVVQADIEARYPDRFKVLAVVGTTIKTWKFPAAIEPIDAFFRHVIDAALERQAKVPPTKDRIRLFRDTDAAEDEVQKRESACACPSV